MDDNYVPAQPEPHTATVGTGQARWRSSQLHAAGIAHTVDYAAGTITVAAEDVEAAEKAMATRGHSTSSPSVMRSVMRSPMSVLFVAFGLVVLPGIGLGALVFVALGIIAMPVERRLSNDVKRTKSEMQRHGVRPSLSTRLMAMGWIVPAIMLLYVLAAIAYVWFGVESIP